MWCLRKPKSRYASEILDMCTVLVKELFFVRNFFLLTHHVGHLAIVFHCLVFLKLATQQNSMRNVNYGRHNFTSCLFLAVRTRFAGGCPISCLPMWLWSLVVHPTCVHWYISTLKVCSIESKQLWGTNALPQFLCLFKMKSTLSFDISFVSIKLSPNDRYQGKPWLEWWFLPSKNIQNRFESRVFVNCKSSIPKTPVTCELIIGFSWNLSKNRFKVCTFWK